MARYNPGHTGRSGDGMAADGGTGFEMKPHERTYSGFLGLLKWGLAASILVTALVVFLIAS